MNDPVADLQTLLTASFLHANITSLSAVPTVLRGTAYESMVDATINVLNSGMVPEGVSGGYRTGIFTMVCQVQINLADSTSKTIIQTCVTQTIAELDRIFSNSTSVNPSFTIQPTPNYMDSHWVSSVSIEATYLAEALPT